MSHAALVRDTLNVSWKEAYRWLDDLAGGDAPSAATQRPAPVHEAPVLPPRERLEAELGRATRIDCMYKLPDDLAAFFERRGLTVHVPAVWLPRSTLLQPGYPLVVPAFTGAGELASLHGRSVPDRTPKTTNPKGFDFRGLLFLDPLVAQPFFAGVGPTPRALIVVEGVTDFLRTAQLRKPDVAIVGIVSGSADALRIVAPRLRGVELFAACDVGPAGDRYNMLIAAALAPHPVRPLPLIALARLRAPKDSRA